MDQVSRALLAAGGGAAEQTYVDDVFSTYLYTGNGATQTITNGIDLAGKGGLVWMKSRSQGTDHARYDTVRGATKDLGFSSSVQTTQSTGLTAFSSTGFTIGALQKINFSGNEHVSWTFRNAPKFFDVVTYTGTGVNRTVAHSLGAVPGCIIVKRTDSSSESSWLVYHRSLANTEYMGLSSVAAKATDATLWNSTTPTASAFSLGFANTVNASGSTYVAYLFAHDAGGFGASGTDNVISCGSFTASFSGAEVNLGWEPQWVMIKKSSDAGSWRILDVMRGFGVQGGADNDAMLLADEVSSENGPVDVAGPTATGFKAAVDGSGATYIYVAIRRPNKPPTTGTQVFQPTVYTGTNTDNRLLDTGLLTDMVWLRRRDAPLGAGNEGSVVGDRLSGQAWLRTATTQAETITADGLDQQLVSTTEYGTAFSSMTGVWIGNNSGASSTAANINVNTTSSNHLALAFRRAPGFFDVVRYTGTGVARTVNHSLGVAPEFILVKARSAAVKWAVYWGANDSAALNEDNLTTSYSVWWNGTAPTASVFTVGTDSAVNGSATTYVAYLFATRPGVSKIGSYTGNGSTTVVDCGFTSGARFVLIRRKSNGGGSAGDWWFWDSARGIVAGTESVTALNISAIYGNAELTGTDAIDPYNPGFAVNQVASTSVNANGVPYFFLAIA